MLSHTIEDEDYNNVHKANYVKMRNGGMKIELKPKIVRFIKSGFDIGFDFNDKNNLNVICYLEDYNSIDEAIAST